MKRLHPQTFLDSLTAYQMMEFIEGCNAQQREFVLPEFVNGEKRVDYEHYLEVDGEDQKLYVCVDTSYTRDRDVVTRTLIFVRIYESEAEMEFYMGLSELENAITEENRVLFN
jgi:hypothetical protein